MIIDITGSNKCLLWLRKQIKESGERIRLNTHNAINNFWWLARNIGSHLTQIAKVVPEALFYIRGSNAAGLRMEGVWLLDANSLYLAAVQDNTLLLALGTKQDLAVADVVAK